MKRKDKEALRVALGAINPFAFRGASGGITIYSSATEGYQLCLQMLWAEFPRGFIDLPYFMHKYQGLTLSEAMELTHRKQYGFVRIWDSDSERRKPVLREVLQVLLSVSGVAFNEDYFLNALANLDIMLATQGVSARTESGAIVDFIK